ncbi:hypothetical protein LN515_02345, partial [Xanthomonas vesicatoria]
MADMQICALHATFCAQMLSNKFAEASVSIEITHRDASFCFAAATAARRLPSRSRTARVMQKPARPLRRVLRNDSTTVADAWHTTRMRGEEGSA